ncbi:MAG TPA: DUF3858 domain-containing protein [Puia sp.]|jgi:hypothetical protein|nr:DUF3858 domain-containing protein [Puia sp.]
MKKLKCSLFIYFLSLCLFHVYGQDITKYQFGNITRADFNKTPEKFDSSSNAIIISDIGNTSFEGNNHGDFTLVFKRYMRVKIINKNGFDIGNYSIDLYHDQEDFEKLYSVKGSTFNLEKGVMTETKLDEKSVFTENYNKNLIRKKFSMPAMKEGSIYDLEYVVKSPFYFRLGSWEFQGEFPCLWSEYLVTIPPPFHYVMVAQGDQQFYLNTVKDIFGSYLIKFENGINRSGIINVSGSSIEHRWVMKNVPALHKEPFITSFKNYCSKLSFQLNYFQVVTDYYTSERHDYLETWSSTSKYLLKDEDFGIALDRVNLWMKDELKEITASASSNDEKARMIYSYVRDNFKSVDKEGYSKNSIWTQNSLKDVFNKKEGNVAEINLLLTAMLRHENIHADPLILSTRDKGMASSVYPFIDEYNYVICVAYLGDKLVTLDASEPYNGYGQLPVACYNGWGHIMNQEKPLPLLFSADSINETNLTSVFITNDEKGKLSGSLKSTFGKSGSFDRRQEIKNSSEKSYWEKIQTLNGSMLGLENFRIDSLNKKDYPLSIYYDFDLKNLLSGDIIYFNPMMNQCYQTNPFISIERHFPVEIPYKIDNTYLMNMEIPAGYQVDELPKSARVAFNENEGLFEYLIQKGENNIQMKVHLKLNKAFFPVDEYSTLRDFFAYVVKKENEQIVFKKIH